MLPCRLRNRTRLGAAHPIAAESTVMTARAPAEPRNTVSLGFLMAMICDHDGFCSSILTPDVMRRF